MTEQELRTNVNQQIKKHCGQRYLLNNGSINLKEVIEEVAYTLAHNLVASVDEANNNSIGFDKEKFEFFIELALDETSKLFPAKFTTEYFEDTLKLFNGLLQDPDLKNIINSHYKELYDTNENIC